MRNNTIFFGTSRGIFIFRYLLVCFRFFFLLLLLILGLNFFIYLAGINLLKILPLLNILKYSFYQYQGQRGLGYAKEGILSKCHFNAKTQENCFINYYIMCISKRLPQA